MGTWNDYISKQKIGLNTNEISFVISHNQDDTSSDSIIIMCVGIQLGLAFPLNTEMPVVQCNCFIL